MNYEKTADGRYWLWRHYQIHDAAYKIDGSIEFTAFADSDERRAHKLLPVIKVQVPIRITSNCWPMRR